MKEHYFDYAATTPILPEVLKAMEPFFCEEFGNPSSIYKKGQKTKRAIQEAREKIAELVNADPSEIIFTSCATESSNFAIKGVTKKRYQDTGKKGNVITSGIEHPSVLNTVKYLEKLGWEARIASVSDEGIVDLEWLKKNIDDETVLISIMMANNEIGTIEPIMEIGQIIKEKNDIRLAKNLPPIYFHVDAVQAIAYLDLDVRKLNIDLMSVTGHKFYAPKGIGFLYIRKGTEIIPLLHGGGQERHLRAGTENVPEIIGLSKALELAKDHQEEEVVRLSAMRDKIISEVLKIQDSQLTGPKENRLPHIASFVFKYVEGESMLLKLDSRGIFASTGSACSSDSLSPSHVLLAIGLKPEVAHGSLRVSLGKQTRSEDVELLIKELPKIIEELREISAVKGEF